MTQTVERDALINRSQMVSIAWNYNLFVSRGTIHRWANEPSFPLPVGKRGKHLLYSKHDYEIYLKRRVEKIQADH